jgi:hypothetical protein
MAVSAAPKKKPQRRKGRIPIHSSIKVSLGYGADEPDAEVLRDWKARLRRVCKPCWELKYCPYGPLVEQSPLLPVERSGAIEHQERLKRMLKTGQLGGRTELSEERRKDLEEWLNDDAILAWQALHQIKDEARDARIAAQKNPKAAFDDPLRGELPPIHHYRVPFEVISDNSDLDNLTTEDRKLLMKKIRERKKKIALTLRTGVEDTRRPLDQARRGFFKEEVSRFYPDDHPEHVPAVFRDGQCNIFGHICPVFFAAEVFTETTTKRRRGRYIPFAVRMRVVRRDNYTCQHCGKHLADNEVEFDHRIPIAKGGSSEEHNVRLTCFDCNRDKRDEVEI